VRVLVGRHGPGLAGLDLGGVQTQGVGALHGAADPPLGDDLKHSGPGQQGDVPVEAARGHIVELGGELARGQRPVAQERLDDAEPHRVQQQVGGGHGPSVNIILKIVAILSSESIRLAP